MKKGLFKKILIGTGSVLLLLTLVLCVHIYIVTRPKPITPGTRMMVRIDIKQPITQDDANNITTWLYRQNGVDHAVCNPGTDIVLFTFSPMKNTANGIVNDFKSKFSLKADRYIPTEKEMSMGCPVASTSLTYKMYKFFKHIL